MREEGGEERKRVGGGKRGRGKGREERTDRRRGSEREEKTENEGRRRRGVEGKRGVWGGGGGGGVKVYVELDKLKSHTDQ